MERTLLITGDSHVILPRIRHQFDLIFVDGDHSETGAIKDLDDCLLLLSPGGIILADDMDHPAHSYLHEATAKWCERNHLKVTFHACGYGVAEISR